MQTVLVGLTEEYGKIPSRQRAQYVEKLQSCVRNVGMMLGSWTGVSQLLRISSVH